MLPFLFVGGLGGPELVIILMLVVLLFGANKLPKLARASGEAMGEFQKGREEIEREIRDATSIDTDATDADATDTNATDADATDADATDADATDTDATDADAIDADAIDADAIDATDADAIETDAATEVETDRNAPSA